MARRWNSIYSKRRKHGLVVKTQGPDHKVKSTAKVPLARQDPFCSRVLFHVKPCTLPTISKETKFILQNVHVTINCFSSLILQSSSILTCTQKSFNHLVRRPQRLLTIPPIPKGFLTNPTCYQINPNQSHLILRDFHPIPLLLKKFQPILSTPQWNPSQFHQLSKDFRPILPNPKRILSSSICSQRNPNQSSPIPKEFWPIPPNPKGILINPTHFQRNYDQSHLISKESRSIHPNSIGILKNPTCSQRNSDQFCPLSLKCWPSSQRNPTYSQSNSDQSHPLLPLNIPFHCPAGLRPDCPLPSVWVKTLIKSLVLIISV